ncbi:hypothetical protein IAQ61_012083 [Plenodomus lingam]|uniref:uncharacterized protein n=1 Tax=Leptosphaeria maculans TaxID=5022 RepID=UPI003328B587|nr:hypothetical protein IAQ61_012083 [Plenodomus lingam]
MRLYNVLPQLGFIVSFSPTPTVAGKHVSVTKINIIGAIKLRALPHSGPSGKFPIAPEECCSRILLRSPRIRGVST